MTLQVGIAGFNAVEAALFNIDDATDYIPSPKNRSYNGNDRPVIPMLTAELPLAPLKMPKPTLREILIEEIPDRFWADFNVRKDVVVATQTAAPAQPRKWLKRAMIGVIAIIAGLVIADRAMAAECGPLSGAVNGYLHWCTPKASPQQVATAEPSEEAQPAAPAVIAAPVLTPAPSLTGLDMSGLTPILHKSISVKPDGSTAPVVSAPPAPQPVEKKTDTRIVENAPATQPAPVDNAAEEVKNRVQAEKDRAKLARLIAQKTPARKVVVAAKPASRPAYRQPAPVRKVEHKVAVGELGKKVVKILHPVDQNGHHCRNEDERLYRPLRTRTIGQPQYADPLVCGKGSAANVYARNWLTHKGGIQERDIYLQKGTYADKFRVPLTRNW